MVTAATTENRFKGWLMQGGAQKNASVREHHQHSWWQVMCLTGVDYFSTLGYQPGIAFLAAGALSPIATLILVLLTLFGAFPVYSRVAAESPHGQGSITMLGKLLPRWRGKLFILCLLGFAATDFIITITLSAADATAHIIENPYTPEPFKHRIIITLALIALLGAIFLKGFGEAIGIAVLLVGVYLLLNVVVVAVGCYDIALHPHKLVEWKATLFAQYSNPLLMIGIAILLFPRLALGLSGFETGVSVMPLIREPHRIHRTRKLLFTAALIMSVMLVTSSIVTTVLIPANEFQPGGKANGRALAYLAHGYLGEKFGTIYDISTVLILWFAGASAMAGLLNIMPRYLPRYGMAPEWVRARRPMTLVFTAISFAVTLIFHADVDAQGGAYATGVLVLMSSAAIAVTLSAWRKRQAAWLRWAFVLVALVFAYTTIANVFERPEGIKIALFFIGSIILLSLASRLWRTTELRVEGVQLDDAARAMIERASGETIHVIANRRNAGDEAEYIAKQEEMCRYNHLLPDENALFLEIEPTDASDFAHVLRVTGRKVGEHQVLSAKSPAVPNAIAAFMLYLRDQTGKIPHVYFNWSERHPLVLLFDYIALGGGDIAPVTHEILRQAEPDETRRPIVHVSGR
jgi:hypothetical protein